MIKFIISASVNIAHDIHAPIPLFHFCFVGLLLVSKEKRKDETYYLYYALSALAYVSAMVSSNWALKWVPYPMQVVGKSAKPIPVMILGVLIGRKSYSIQRYVFVLVIVVGVVLFMLKDGKTSNAEYIFGLGEILLLVSLTCDGFTAAIQERMRRKYSPSAKHMMFAMNAWSSVILIIAIVPSGQLLSFVAFAGRHPEVIYKLALLALAGSSGQFFIFVMVSSFGPLPCSIATTTRKFFTVLFSVIWFQNVLSVTQWIGCGLVFIGLFADAIFGKNRRKKPEAVENEQKPDEINGDVEANGGNDEPRGSIDNGGADETDIKGNTVVESNGTLKSVDNGVKPNATVVVVGIETNQPPITADVKTIESPINPYEQVLASIKEVKPVQSITPTSIDDKNKENGV